MEGMVVWAVGSGGGQIVKSEHPPPGGWLLNYFTVSSIPELTTGVPEL